MQTFAEVLEKLMIMHLKLWHLEDIKHDPKASDKEVADAARKICVANKQRSVLKAEIDEMVSKGEFPTYDEIKMY